MIRGRRRTRTASVGHFSLRPISTVHPREHCNEKIAKNPLPDYEGGYGKPLGSKRSFNLTGLLKCKLRKDGIRIVYQVVQRKGAMHIVVIGARTDEEVYRLAAVRREKYGL